MRILFITHRLPCPPDRGCKIRSAALLHGLARRHDVWCAGFLDNVSTPELQAATRQSMTDLRDLCRGLTAVPFRPWLAGYRAVAGMCAGATATESYFASRALQKAIGAWSREISFDAVFAFSSGVAPQALRVPARRRVLCMDDLDSRKWHELSTTAGWPGKLVYGTEARRLARREMEWLCRFDATIMVARREADLVSDPELRRKVHVIPPILPGMPTCDGSQADAAPADAAPGFLPVRATGPVIGFIGAMDYPPNVDAACWLAREIWPRVLHGRPDARLMLVGRSPGSDVRHLGTDDSIVVTGTVPDVNGYLSAMRVHVAPLRVSRGVQIKVVAAMAAGRPCVVTSRVAEGLSARAGRDLLVADSPAAFAAAVLDLLNKPDKAEAIGRAGQAFVRQFNPEKAIARVERLLAGSAVPIPPVPGAVDLPAAAATPFPRGCAVRESNTVMSNSETGGGW